MCESPSTPEASSLQTLRKMNGRCCGCPGMAVRSECVEQCQSRHKASLQEGFPAWKDSADPKVSSTKNINQLTHMSPFGAYSQSVGAASWFGVLSLLLSPDNLCSFPTLPHITQQIATPAPVLHVAQLPACERASPWQTSLPPLPHSKQDNRTGGTAGSAASC